MDALLQHLPGWLARAYWPFCRVAAALWAAPILGEASLPVRARLSVALVLAAAMLPSIPAVAVDPFSWQGVTTALDQALLGLTFGMAFYCVHGAFSIVGFLIASQMGLAMAAMNDPSSGASSDIVSILLQLLCIMFFFSLDGHLVLVQVVYSSFQIWPIGASPHLETVRAVIGQVGWLFAAATLLAAPAVFATMVVQIGMGFLNRAARSINLFSLGFTVTTLFGIGLCAYLMKTMPAHYARLTEHILAFLDQRMRA